MSRDATGIYSAAAVQSSTCPVCRMGPGWPCNLDVPGYEEHGTHWERTEEAPPWPPHDPARHVAFDLMGNFLGQSEWTEEQVEHAEIWARKIREHADEQIRRSREPQLLAAMAKADAEARIRSAFTLRYGFFWKCLGKPGHFANTGAFMLGREPSPGDWTAPVYVEGDRGCGAYYVWTGPGDHPPKVCRVCGLEGSIRPHGYSSPPIDPES